MEKVICLNCGSSGYTASPRYTTCTECGGSYKVVEEAEFEEPRKAEDDEEKNKVFLLKV